MTATQTLVTSKPNLLRGVSYTLPAVAGGILLWIALWQGGYQASFVAFGVAWAAVKLFGMGYGHIDRRGALAVVSVVIVTMVLAFVAGMTSDMMPAYTHDQNGKPLGISTMEALTSSDFWNFWQLNIFHNGELWGLYTTDILIAVAFAALGSFGVLKEVFITPAPLAKQATTTPKPKAKLKAKAASDWEKP